MMKKQVKLTETELFDVIEESVKSLVMEYGEKNPKVRSAMAKAAKRDLDNGNDETYHRAVKSIADAGGSNEALQDFNDKFEKESLNSQPANNITGESRIPIKVSESQLMTIIGESVMRILAEAEIDPRSWDAVARRYDQTDPQKAAYARQRAAQQWNNIYGIDDYSDVDANGTNVHSTAKSNMNVGDDGNYLINQSVNDIRTKGNGKISNNSSTVDYNPKTQIGSYTEKGSSGMNFNPNGNGAYQNTQQGDLYMYGTKKNSPMGKIVAQQMAQGNGVYDKSKGGWQ